MPAVFERFLTAALTTALARRGVRCAAQEQHHRLDRAGQVRLRPDLVLYRAGRTVSVVDAKYAARHSPAPPTEHLYQLLGYCVALGLPRGHLVYAATSRDGSTEHAIRRMDITVTAHALDLGRPPAQLLTAISDLADRLTALPAPDVAEADVPPGATRE